METLHTYAPAPEIRAPERAPDVEAPTARVSPFDLDYESSLLAAYAGGRGEHIPAWFMRQAGRSLPEYRALRDAASLTEITRTPELAAEATVLPVRRYGVDAAILFSDIVSPLGAIGVDVEIRPGVGPVVAAPIRTARDLRALRAFTPAEDAPWLAETVRLAVEELKVPLVGLAGGPFTLASYLIDGGPSKTHARTKALMLTDSLTWRRMLERLAAIAVASLTTQVQAGARAVQVFDSWIGSIAPDHYRLHVLPVVRRMFAALEPLDVPRIYFGVGTDHLLELMGHSGADVVGIDWRVPLDVARRRLPRTIGLQGNLDPAACLTPWDALEIELRDVLSRAPDRGYVFNLGHGLPPETEAATLSRVVELVRDYRHERALLAATG